MGLDNVCASRGFPPFAAPNKEGVTYQFDFLKNQEIVFLKNQEISTLPEIYTLPVDITGFRVQSSSRDRHALNIYTVKEYTPKAAQLQLYVSGRVFVQYLDKPTGMPPNGLCAFGICTRGRPIYQSLKTQSFVHTAQVVTSGVVFALYLHGSSSGFYLCPRISLVCENGNEICLVDDRLGPLRSESFYADFAIVDDGGRNVQLDIILRGVGVGPEETATSTFRTCLQDYTAFNNMIAPANIALGYSSINSSTEAASVHLQNLVISEQQFQEKVPEPQPYDVWKDAHLLPEKESASKILFEGEDARVASMAIDVPESPVAHPQLQPRRSVSGQGRGGGGDLVGSASRQGQSSYLKWLRSSRGAASNLLIGGADSRASDFWYHIQYRDRNEGSEVVAPMAGLGYPPRVEGEFWLSKATVEKKGVYFHCSSTLAQAVTMCIAFRFSCPTDFLTLIEARAANVLRHTHIPTNGVIMGVEEDPRDASLFRMFIEHRNEILEDMVVCESGAAGLARTVVHQEVYDGGSTIFYRLTLMHADGSRQSAVLEAAADQFEDPNSLDTPGRTNTYQLVEDPSPRFPISPCLVRHDLSPQNRVFIYSSVQYDDTQQAVDEATDGGGSINEDFQSTRDHQGESIASDNPGEEWQSAGWDPADMDQQQVVGATPTASAHGAGAGNGSRRRAPSVASLDTQKENPEAVEWRRPVIESVVLLSRVDEPPFKCFPSSLS